MKSIVLSWSNLLAYPVGLKPAMEKQRRTFDCLISLTDKGRREVAGKHISTKKGGIYAYKIR